MIIREEYQYKYPCLVCGCSNMGEFVNEVGLWLANGYNARNRSIADDTTRILV